MRKQFYCSVTPLLCPPLTRSSVAPLLPCLLQPPAASFPMTQILVIDDDAQTRNLLQRTLNKQGYTVSVAGDGKEGLRLAKQLKPSLIICDWIMPETNGLDVCRQIKATPELATTFFILLTALGSVENRVEGLDAGSDDFLSKPFDMYELQARVRAGLRLHELNQDLNEQKQLLELELAEAAEYVSSILPEPLISPNVNIDVRFIPSRQLGGDGFDFYWLDDRHLVIYLLDVAGHGLRAALPSLAVINLLRSRSLNNVNYYRPREVLLALNQTFQITDRNDKYFTIWYGVYNIKTRELTYATGGHPPAILLSSSREKPSEEKRLRTAGVPIGMFADVDYDDICCQINAHSSLYIFSDGIYEIEQNIIDGNCLENFINILKKYHHGESNNLDDLLHMLPINSKHDKPLRFDDDLSIVQIYFK
jgi:phosphoserine phosphatase RsbU/P